MNIILLTVAALLVAMLASGLWVSLSLFAVSYTSLEIFKNLPIETILGRSIWNSSTSTELLSLPMFILMAEILFRTRLSDQLLKGLTPWATLLPGRLLHINVLACTLFATVSGSSAATTQIVGKITLNELRSRGYDRSLVAGSLAGAGTLGLLIPPSIVLIIYGILANVSILKLFLAGIVPGLLIAASFMAYLGVRASLNPALLPTERIHYSWSERFQALKFLVPIACLMTAVLGSLYGGLASPTEAAVIGVIGALITSIFSGSFTRSNIATAFLRAARTTSMIGLIVISAGFLTLGMGYLGIPRAAAGAISALGLSPFALMVGLIVFYLLLGMVLEGLSALVLTIPITLPLVVAAGFDPVWFGVFAVITIEMAQITPPVGFNLFVIQGLTGESLSKLTLDAFPFLLILIAVTLLITLFPTIVLWLPEVMGYK